MIYFDNAATTQMFEESYNEMLPYLREHFLNPSSLYSNYSDIIQNSKNQIAQLINAEPDEIIFTSGGSESNNFIFLNYDNIITSSFEHASIINQVPSLFKGNQLIPILKTGYIDLKKLENKCKNNPNSLVSIMHLNNEIGTIQDIKTISNIAHKYNCLFHTDAVQSVGHFHIDVKEMNIDFLSGSGHKFNACKGIGFIYVSKKYKDKLYSLISGGNQNYGLRGGTYDLASIVSIGTSAKISYINLLDENKRNELFKMRDILISEILKIPNVFLNVMPDSLIMNFYVRNVNAEQLVALLAQNDIYISNGSACHSGSPVPSHVLSAIGLNKKKALSSIRISLGNNNNINEIEPFLCKLKENIEILRKYN